jgi:hypothetical protein
LAGEEKIRCDKKRIDTSRFRSVNRCLYHSDDNRYLVSRDGNGIEVAVVGIKLNTLAKE